MNTDHLRLESLRNHSLMGSGADSNYGQSLVHTSRLNYQSGGARALRCAIVRLFLVRAHTLLTVMSAQGAHVISTQHTADFLTASWLQAFIGLAWPQMSHSCLIPLRCSAYRCIIILFLTPRRAHTRMHARL